MSPHLFRLIVVSMRPFSRNLLGSIAMASACQTGALAAFESSDPVALENFPTATQLWLCYAQGSLNPVKEEAVISEAAGVIRFLKGHQAMLEKSEVFAISQPERLELTRKTFELETTLNQKQLKEALLDQEEAVIALVAKKAEGEAELMELEAASEEIADDGDAQLKQRLQAAIQASRDKIERLQKRIELTEATAAEGTNILQLELEQLGREQDFEKAQRAAEYRSPFQGYFTFSDEFLAENADKSPPFHFWVEATDVLGHVTDASSYEITFAQYPPILDQVPLEQTFLEIPFGGDNAPIGAKFLENSSLARAGIGGRRESVLVYQVDEKDRERVKPLAGTTPSGQIFLELPEGCHLVPKTKLITLLKGGERKSSGGWASIARSVWPDVEMIAAGHLHIALRLNDSQKAKPTQTAEEGK